MAFKFSERTIKILIFIFFTTIPLLLMMNIERFDYYSAFDELKRATGIPRQHLEIMNFWRRGNDYVVKVRIYKKELFKVKFIKAKDSFKAELGMWYDEGWKPLKQFLKENNLNRQSYEKEQTSTGK